MSGKTGSLANVRGVTAMPRSIEGSAESETFRGSVAGPYSRHLPTLDGLRGLAILGVLEFHLFPGEMPGRIAGTLLRLRVVGAAGVDLFFALSGFLITGILYDSLGDPGYFRKFYVRRALRIFPLYYGVLSLLFALTPWLRIDWHGMAWVLMLYLQNTDVNGPFYNLHLGDGLSLDHFWSLAVEEQFYLLWPLVIFAARARRRLIGVCVGVIVAAPSIRFVLAVHGADPHSINRSTPCRMDALVLGALLALMLRGRWHDYLLRSAKSVFWGVAVVAGALLLGAMMSERQLGAPDIWSCASLALRYSLLALGSTALLAWALRPETRVRRLFEGRVLRWFGRYSYGLYVWHFVALGLLIEISKRWIAILTPSKAAGVVGAGLISFGVSLVAAYLSYQLFESRFLQLKRFFRYGPDSPTA